MRLVQFKGTPRRPVSELIIQATRWMASTEPNAKTMVVHYRDLLADHPDSKNNPRADRVINACTAFIVS